MFFISLQVFNSSFSAEFAFNRIEDGKTHISYGILKY